MTKYIAHRGYALKKDENTLAAFEHSAKSKAFGIETDVHITKDDIFVVFHDDSTLRLCGEEKIIEDTVYNELQNLKILKNHKIPTLKEFLECCKNGGKTAVIELKNPFSENNIKKLINEIDEADCLETTIFISFDFKNVATLRDILPQQEIQFITLTYDIETLYRLAEKKIDLDIEYTCLSKDRIEFCHILGIKVNCWTLNDAKIANHFENCGMDYITSNNLENSISGAEGDELENLQ